MDFIPIVGGIKGLVEGCVGKTMSGEKLTANEQTQYKLMGVVSIGLDIFTLGTATAAIQGVKTGSKLVSTMGKFVLTDVAVGWGTKFTSEAMLNIGMSPQLVFAIHIGTNFIVAKHNTKVKNVNNMKDINSKNVDDIIKGASGANIFDIDVAQQKLNNIRGKMPNQNLKSRGNMAIANVKVEGVPNEFVAHNKIHNSASKGADMNNFSFTSEKKFFETYVEDGFPRYNDTEAKILLLILRIPTCLTLLTYLQNYQHVKAVPISFLSLEGNFQI